MISGVSYYRPVYSYGVPSEYAAHGKCVKHRIIICCPGDWHDLKRRMKRLGHDMREWTTVRFGVYLLALGPPSGGPYPIRRTERGRRR